MQWIDRCLKSIVNKTHVIVVDNASTDETVKFIATNYPEVNILENTENLGFGKANNLGMSYALKQDAQYVFLLNQDTFVHDEAIKHLVSASVKHPEYGILSPLQLSGGESIDLMFSHYLLANPAYYYDAAFRKKNKDVYSFPFLNAAAWLLPKSTLETIGGFDPIFFHYGEDENYAQRVLYHKLNIGLVTQSVINHDREQYLKTNKTLFSEGYYKAFEKHLKVTYANPNSLESSNFWKRYKTKYLKKAMRGLLGFDLKAYKGYMRQHAMLSKIIDECNQSKETTKTIGDHYL